MSYIRNTNIFIFVANFIYIYTLYVCNLVYRLGKEINTWTFELTTFSKHSIMAFHCFRSCYMIQNCYYFMYFIKKNAQAYTSTQYSQNSHIPKIHMFSRCQFVYKFFNAQLCAWSSFQIPNRQNRKLYK